MSSHGSNGRGSTVSITGHLIVVDTSDIGAAVDRSSTLPLAPEPAGVVCQTTITAATSAHTADSTRSLATITPRSLSDPAGSVAVRRSRPDRKQEPVLVAESG